MQIRQLGRWELGQRQRAETRDVATRKPDGPDRKLRLKCCNSRDLPFIRLVRQVTSGAVPGRILPDAIKNGGLPGSKNG